MGSVSPAQAPLDEAMTNTASYERNRPATEEITSWDGPLFAPRILLGRRSKAAFARGMDRAIDAIEARSPFRARRALEHALRALGRTVRAGLRFALRS